MHKHLFALLLLFASSLAFAVDGAREINAACVSFGCFDGDSSGFPVTITQAGKYVLTSNLTQSGNLDVIEITAFDVSLDLNGFLIDGPAICTGTPVTSCSNTGAGYGIHVFGADNVRIFNGHIRQTRDTCIFSNTTGANISNNLWVEGVSISQCGGSGIVAQTGIIKNVVIDRVEASGVSSFFGSILVTDSHIRGSGDFPQFAGTCGRNVYQSHTNTPACIEIATNICDGVTC